MFQAWCKHKVGTVGIMVTRNKDTENEFQEDFGSHDVYEYTKIGLFFKNLNDKIKDLNNKLHK